MSRTICLDMFRNLRVALLLCAAIEIGVRVAAQTSTEAVKINDAIYMAPAGGNVYLIITPAGNVVIDTSSEGQAANAKKILKAVSNAPVKYIILTHGHADHIGGIGLWKEPGTQIIAQRNYIEFLNYTTRLEGFFAPRNAAGFNRPVKEVGPWAGNFGAKIDPTIFFDEKYEFTLGGTRFELFSTPGETPDHLTVWIPAYKTAFIGDNYDGAGLPEPKSFPAIYTLRGTRPRPALDWIHSIDTVLALKPEILLSGHGDPIVGNQEITRRLTRFRDAIQYIHDEVIKGMNDGKDVFTLMQEIKLPPSFDLTESFGKVNWSVRGIYDGYAGWFDTNPASLYSEPPSSVYPDLVRLAGGPEPIVQLALAKVKDGKAVEALHLTDVVLAYDQKNIPALKARLEALDYLENKCQNFIEEGWLQSAITKTKAKLPTE
jgi:alkyl sulfatase BDS1-like metallo-beta-lactamase superfamily hydrolase